MAPAKLLPDIRHPLFTIRHPLFTIRYPLFTIRFPTYPLPADYHQLHFPRSLP